MIVAAHAKTQSNLAAARYLHVSYQHYRKFAKIYVDEATGKSLFELAIFDKDNNFVTKNLVASAEHDVVGWLDKDLRILTYKVMLEKFNGKYASLNDNQKIVLKEFISSVDSTPKLREFYNTKVEEIKEEINTISKKVTDKAIQIKLNEVTNLLSPLGKISNVGNDDLVNLLQYYELLEELVKANG